MNGVKSLIQMQPRKVRVLFYRAFALMLGLFIFAARAYGEESKNKERIEDNAEYQAALRALSYGLPDVAALKWERLLKNEKLSRNEEMKVSERFVDALLRARLPDRALLALTLFQIEDTEFWRGQCFLGLRRFRDAEHCFKEYLALTNTSYSAEAHLALGKTIIAQGRENTGRKEFKALIGNQNKAIAHEANILWNESEILSDRATDVRKRLGETNSSETEIEFVKGCALLSEGESAKAQRIFELMSEAQVGISERLHEASLLRLAEAYSQRGRGRKAQREIINYLKPNTPRQFEESAFALLRKVTDPEDDSVPQMLLAWASAPLPASRNALALYHYADWLGSKGRQREAIPFIEKFLIQYPGHELENNALRLAMECHGVAGDDERVLELATLWKEKFSTSSEGAVDFLTAMIRFSRKEFVESSMLFQRAADSAVDTVQKKRAVYNEAVAALLGGQTSLFQSCSVQLKKGVSADNAEAAEDSAAQLMIERALHMAGERDANTEAALQEFIKAYPNHPRVSEAHIALAEFCLLAVPPRPKAAEAALAEARKIFSAPDEWKERLDYTEIWVRETDADLEGTAAQGLAFINQWPKSSRRGEVRMKVAQAYYRLEEFTKALDQFNQLAEEKTESPYAEAARFFAGKSAMALMNEKGLDQAIEFWRQVADGGGPLAMESRRQQALAKRRQGKDSDALAAIDALLTGKPAPVGEMRLSLLIEKGEMLFVSSTQSLKNLDDAAAIFQAVRTDASASRNWRGRAGVLLAQCYERMGKTSEALEACHDVVEATLATDVTKLTPSDFLWLYRAGFFALDLIEGKQEWEGAARLADRLAQAGGDRSDEAKKRATAIKTGHFIWDK